jgi:formate dehydrogenase maturation protein FdhE
VVSREFQALAAARAARARLLAGRYPASQEALLFYAKVVTLQGRLAASLPSNPGAGRGFALDSLLPGRQPLIELVEGSGTERLREQARDFDESACREALRAYFTNQDTTSAQSFFARVLLQPAMFAWASAVPNAAGRGSSEPDGELLVETPRQAVDPHPAATCPCCGHAPQAGCLRPQGDGSALALVCSLCLHEWPFARAQCPACGNTDHHKISYYATPEFAHLKVQACESCRAYLHLVDLSKETQAIADVDEMAALPLDFWAIENGYCKVHPNLAGI